MPGGPRYRLAAQADDGAPMGAVPFGGQLSAREWGDEWALFDGASGDCHLLSPVCGVLVEELLAAPAEGLLQASLFERAFGDDDAPLPEEQATFDAALERLVALGLVRILA